MSQKKIVLLTKRRSKMYKTGWKEYITEVKLSLREIERELGEFLPDVDIRATWHENLTAELKNIIRRSAELL
jgi:hypothetical protein